jgi:serine/threonine protein kinase
MPSAAHVTLTRPYGRSVEEYAGKGDVFNDAISHPDKYTEQYVACTLVAPLLAVLAHLHGHNVIHRCV